MDRQPDKAAMYQINIDLETRNIAGGEPNCRSPMHKHIGRHREITIHSFPSKCRRANNIQTSTRYWDDNKRQGYTLENVVARARAIIASVPGLMVRRCRRCSVPQHIPDWD